MIQGLFIIIVVLSFSFIIVTLAFHHELPDSLFVGIDVACRKIELRMGCRQQVQRRRGWGLRSLSCMLSSIYVSTCIETYFEGWLELAVDIDMTAICDGHRWDTWLVCWGLETRREERECMDCVRYLVDCRCPMFTIHKKTYNHCIWVKGC